MANGHPSWVLPVTDEAKLLLTSCPGTRDSSVMDVLQGFKQQGARVLITAIESNEVSSAQFSALASSCEVLGLAWYHLPIEDDCAPESNFEHQWQQIKADIALHQAQGSSIAIHCMGGSGRTGLIAGRILLDQNWSVPKVIEAIQHLRPNAFTKAAHQDYIQQFV